MAQVTGSQRRPDAAQVTWSRWRGEDCLRVRDVVAGEEVGVEVRPQAAAVAGGLPPMAGRLVRDGDDACFVPRFAFVAGTTYTVGIGGAAAVSLVRPRSSDSSDTEVVGIHPTATEVPRNLLRLYVWFSAPMSEGQARDRVRIVDDAGDVLAGALLPTEHELWDPDRIRLTILLDPARIKRGLVAHRRAGYPLRLGTPFRLVVDEGFRDARGGRLRTGAERRYEVRGDERRPVDPARWVLGVPAARTTDPLHVGFGRPLDHALLGRCLRVTGADGTTLPGYGEVGPEERSWRWVPRAPWAAESHGLVVDPVLEDVAGNSVARVFDRDLTRRGDDPRRAAPVVVAFGPR